MLSSLTTQEHIVIVGVVSILVSILCAQLLKRLTIPKQEWRFGQNGGMPSSHAGIVACAFTLAFYATGLSLYTFLAFAIGIIILRDSLGVRYAVGNNARILRSTLPRSKQRSVIIEEGHTVKEMIAGLSLGLVVTLTLLLVFDMPVWWTV